MYTINFTNGNSDIASPWITFVQATQIVSGVTQLVGPALSATGGDGTALANGTSYNLAAIGNSVSMGPTNWQGHLYVSDAALTLPTSGSLPVDMAYTSTSDTTRYQYLEFAGSATQASIDITYINWYSIPLQMQSSTSQSSPTRGAPISQSALAALPQALAALTGSNGTVTVTNADNQLVRVISPNAGNPSWLPLYPSFNGYLNSVFTGSTAASIPIDNSYSGIGSPPSPDFQPQSYKVSSVTYDGSTLTILGSSSLLGSFTMTSSMSAAQFNSVIYLAVMNYAWSYAGSGSVKGASNANGNTGDNNVFSAVSRDLMAGFAFGFISSTAYGKQPSSAWMGASAGGVFSAIQPDNAYYNPWANAVATAFSDVYSFPFNDFLNAYAPEIQVNDGDTLTVTLLDTGS